jgi:hypothetical protein
MGGDPRGNGPCMCTSAGSTWGFMMTPQRVTSRACIFFATIQRTVSKWYETFQGSVDFHLKLICLRATKGSRTSVTSALRRKPVSHLQHLGTVKAHAELDAERGWVYQCSGGWVMCESHDCWLPVSV